MKSCLNQQVFVRLAHVILLASDLLYFQIYSFDCILSKVETDEPFDIFGVKFPNFLVFIKYQLDFLSKNRNE